MGVFLLLALALAWRLLAPAPRGWVCFPVMRRGLGAQCVGLWLAGRCYGRREVLRALNFAATELRRREPKSFVAYLDVSSRRGGRLWPHLSHRHGVDVDVLYFGRSKDGRPFPWRPALLVPGYLLRYHRDGACGSLRFDAERTWVFVDALRRNPHAGVEKIFVEPWIKPWILAAGDHLGAGPRALRWAGTHLRYAGPNSAPHTDHLHIRFLPPPGMDSPRQN